MQAINVFRGGSLVQDLDGHASPAYPSPGFHAHPLEIVPDSRFARILGESTATVNTYHHQAVRPSNLGAGLTPVGTAPHPDGELVGAVEDVNPERWLLGVQSHPERTESMPPEFGKLWRAFVEAAARFVDGEGMVGSASASADAATRGRRRRS